MTMPVLHERREPRLSFPIVRGQAHEHADAPHPLALQQTKPPPYRLEA